MKKQPRKKLTPEQAKKRFDCRTDIELCLDGYLGWKKKSKFWDKIVQDWFWSIPYDVLKHEIVHPKRRTDKRKRTNIKNWGVEHTTQSKEVKRKTKQTNLKKYGKEYYLQTEDKKRKTVKTNIKKYGVRHHMQEEAVSRKYKQAILTKYGVENVQQNVEVKEKTNKTVKDKYGVENISQSTEIKEKKKATSLKNWNAECPLQSPVVRNKGKETVREKFGVEHPMHSEQIKGKVRKTCMKRYGVSHFTKTKTFQHKIKKKKIAGSNQFIVDWLKIQQEPKPSISTINQIFVRQDIVPENELGRYLIRYRNYKSSLEDFSEKLFETKHYNKKPDQIASLFRPDFKLSPTVFLNVDGLYWHSEAQKEKWYHYNIRKEFEKCGLRLIQFREDEIYEKPKIVQSITNNALGKTPRRIYARNTKIVIVPQKQANIFLEENHLMGSINARHIGLFHNDILVSILSYKQRKNVCKIERFCSEINNNLVGGFSKLLKHLERNCLNPEILEIHNWVDLRYGTGVHLTNKGFSLERETLGWKWTDNKQTYNRLKCRANMDHRKLSQREYAKELGWMKIFDAGQRLWIKR